MSKDLIGVQGYFHIQSWDNTGFEQLKEQGIEVTSANLHAAGFSPNSSYFHKNKITDEGYNWIRGQLLGQANYGSKMGEMGFLTREDTASVGFKKIIRSAGRKPGEIVYEASWDSTEIPDKNIYRVEIYTYTDTTTPAEATRLLYAYHDLKTDYFKKYGEALTVTRYEFFQNKQ